VLFVHLSVPDKLISASFILKKASPVMMVFALDLLEI